MDPAKHTCLKLKVTINSDPLRTEILFVKGTWYPTRFDLFITNGHDSWTCQASEEEVKERASQWDQPVSEYIDLAEQYLGLQQPGSVYGFADAGNGHRRVICLNSSRSPSFSSQIADVLYSGSIVPTLISMWLSWTFEKSGTKLEWRWKCQPSPDSKKTTAEILDFLLEANIRLSDEVVRKTQSFDRLNEEAEKCLTQSEKFSKEKEVFESEIYAKFVGVLNSKKAKLRELRDQLSRKDTGRRTPEEEEEQSFHKTVSYDEESEDEPKKNDVGTSKVVPASKPRGRKRK